MKMTYILPEQLSPALCQYVQEVLDGIVQGVSHLPTDVQKHIEWIGMTYEGNVPLPKNRDHFKIEVKLGFDLGPCLKVVSQAVEWKVDVYGWKELRLRVAEEFRNQVLLLIERLSSRLDDATKRAKSLLM